MIRRHSCRKTEPVRTNSVSSVAFSPDGTRLLSGSRDRTLKLWGAATGQLLHTFEGHADQVHSVAFSPGGTRLLSGSRDRTLKLWDAATGQLISTFKGHADPVASVGFSPDGTRLLSGSWDRTLKLWDAATGQVILTFEGHSDWVTSVAFSPHGTRVGSASSDGTIRVWDAAIGSHLATLMGGRDGEWLAMTPSGFFAASTPTKGTEMLSVVRGLESYSLMKFYEQLHRPDLVEALLNGDPKGKYRAEHRTGSGARAVPSGQFGMDRRVRPLATLRGAGPRLRSLHSGSGMAAALPHRHA